MNILKNLFKQKEKREAKEERELKLKAEIEEYNSETISILSEIEKLNISNTEKVLMLLDKDRRIQFEKQFNDLLKLAVKEITSKPLSELTLSEITVLKLDREMYNMWIGSSMFFLFNN